MVRKYDRERVSAIVLASQLQKKLRRLPRLKCSSERCNSLTPVTIGSPQTTCLSRRLLGDLSVFPHSIRHLIITELSNLFLQPPCESHRHIPAWKL